MLTLQTRLAGSPLRTLIPFAAALLAACGGASDDATTETAQDAVEAKVQLTPNDLSVLFPITETGFLKNAIRVSERGAKGSIVPTWVFKNPDGIGDLIDTSILVAVGVRFDPCANIRVAKRDADCERQLRVVWQGLFESDTKDGSVKNVRDSNLHTIYRLNDDEFRGLLAKVRSAKSAAKLDDSKSPLGPQPVIQAQGMAGPYAKVVLDAVRQLAGETNLVRAAFLEETVQSNEWVFTAFDVKDGKPVKANLPTLRARNQQLEVLQVPPFDVVSAKSSSPDDLMFLQPKLGGEKDSIKAKDAARAIVSSFRVEDPRVHDAKTIDCGSCHLSPVTRMTLVGMGFPIPSNATPFTSKRWNLTSVSTEKVVNDSLQMFSYRPGGLFQPSVRARVIAESAMAADYVNETLPF
jgi:hypothetical protein